MADVSEIQNKTIALIDRLKAITFNAGLAGGGNEYIILTEVFLYKFLNDKFVSEAKHWNKGLADAENLWEYLDHMTEDDYDNMCDCMQDVVELRRYHLIPYLATRQNEPDFAKLFDSTLEDIAKTNQTIFYIQNSDRTKEPILRPISDFITGGTQKKNDFCKSLIGAISEFSFEEAFSCGYDFFSTIFEYLIKDYNANGGGTYAEYYTPHAVAAIMAQLLVDPSEDVHAVQCYDPSAGTGTLVIALAHAIGSRNCTVYTQDISDKSSTMMMLNMILNGFAHSLNHVVHGNTLSEPYHKSDLNPQELRKFDYIVSNPPFKLDFSDFRDRLTSDTYKGRFFAGIPNVPAKDRKKMEIYLCFLQHVIYSLKPDGKAAIVVPTGFITAGKGIGGKIHSNLIDNKILRGVVTMPSNIFANTGTNVSVVFIDKSKQNDEVVLIDASGLGTEIKEGNITKTKLSDEEVKLIVSTFREKKAVDDFSVVVSPDDIKNKNLSFSAGQYFDVQMDYTPITSEEFAAEMAQAKSDLSAMFQKSAELEKVIVSKLQILKTC